MINVAVDFLICMFEVYVFYDFLHDIIERRTDNKTVIYAVLGVMSVIMYGINYCHLSQVNLPGGLLLFLLGTFLLFGGNIKTKISYYLIFYIIMTGMEFVVGILFFLLNSSEFLAKELYPFRNFLLVVITKLVSYVSLRLVKIFLNSKEVGTSGKLLKMIFLFPVTTILVYAGLFYANIQMEEGKIVLCIGCILLLFANVLVFYIIERLTFVMEQNSEYKLMSFQNSFHNAYYSKLEEVEKKHKRYAHDLKEYLQTIGGLAVKCKSEEIVDILKEMEVEIDSIPDKKYINNTVLNALICEKELQAQKENIEFNIMIEPELSLEKIKNVDLVVMVGNLIDNAIEAATLCKGEKRINLKFYETDGNFIVLDIENTYGNNIRRKGKKYLTTKKDEKYHGIGIKSVKEKAEKYGGLLFLEQKDNLFVSILTLSKSAPIKVYSGL